MQSILLGALMLGASWAILYPFIPKAGQEPHQRSEWFDILIVLVSASSFMIGVGLLVTSVVSLLYGGA